MTRSGIVSSVHSFAQSDIGTYFLSFLVLSIVVSVGFLLYRLKDLESPNKLDSMLSRESAFLLNNLVLVGAAVAILWGTIFPVLSEAVRGVKISIGPPYFNKVMVPIGLMLLILTGIGPMIAWRKTSWPQLKKTFVWPVLFSILVCILATILTSIFYTIHIAVITAFTFCAFVVATIYLEYKKGVQIRMRALKENFLQALIRLVRKDERRYGGYIVHLGIVLLFIGFSGAAFKVEKEFQMVAGQAQALGNYTFRYDQIDVTRNTHKEVFTSKFSIWKNDKPFSYAYPAKVLYRSQIEGEPPQVGTEVFIKRSLVEDLYFALLSFDENQQSVFVKVIINPLVQYIWIGGLMLVLGTMVVMWPAPKRKQQQRIA
ncbi:MAG: cytochrome c-type biogenesis CcmF C-terminal domain-containing protein [Bdellovibrionota bacterium]